LATCLLKALAACQQGFSWAGNTTLNQQAAWLAEAAQIAKNSGYVRLAIVFNLDFHQV
jgi:hypothetical protein